MLSFGSALAVLLCLTTAQKPKQEGESFNLTTHSNLTLHPRHRGISKQEWRLGRDVKIAIWEKGIGYSYPKGPFQGRVTINETSITLFDLRPNDSTTLIYFAEDSVGTEEEYPYVLSIRDPLRPPVIKVIGEKQTGSEGRYRLQCVAQDNHTSITYHWYTSSLEPGNSSEEVSLLTGRDLAVTCRISDGHSRNSMTLVIPLNTLAAAPYGSGFTTLFLAVLALILLCIIVGYTFKRLYSKTDRRFICNPYRECFGNHL
ncbi:ORF11 [Fowl aviadenovirus E]|uniref:ORF11 n=1 Tax=Fowl aviadenovirus E TaxID=190065 RepID=A0A650BZU2_9ADEN|nr:ORF11 [Fowl aviadenovirus E]